MYQFCYHYSKPKYEGKSKAVLYGNTQFHCLRKTDDIYRDIAEDNETRFDSSN